MIGIEGLGVQLLNGLASASTLFLLSAGLSLIFGVTRIVNFAHGSLYMVGVYIAWSLTARLSGAVGFWLSILLSAVAVGLLGAVIEIVLLRRIYKAPELFQLLATFALTLVIRDAVLYAWGSEDLLGPRAPGLEGSLEIFGRRFPRYDLLLIAVGPAVLGLMHLLLTRTRWGVLVRAATQDREMVGALGVNQTALFTGAFAIGAALAGLSGALQLPREPASASMDIAAIGDAFVVVVVGGMGSLPGAFVAALLISEIKALCIALGVWTLPGGFELPLPKLTLVAEFVIMAVVLVWKPYGLMGAPPAAARTQAAAREQIIAPGAPGVVLIAVTLAACVLLPLIVDARSYSLVLMIDAFVAVLFAASLHFLMGPAGMHSFGHAAYFGLGAYASAICFKTLGAPMEIALALSTLGGFLGALLFGWFCVRLTGVYLAMLTLAFGQISWSIVYQWDSLTGGSNGMTGVWPSPGLAPKPAYYFLALAACLSGVALLWRILFSPFGLTLRATRDSVLRSEAIGLDVHRVQWTAFCIAGLIAGLAGGLYVFSKGSISPETLGVGRSIDGLVMVLLGGVDALLGPIVGAASYIFLQDEVARRVEYWRAMLGFLIIILVLAFPDGVAGALRRRQNAR